MKIQKSFFDPTTPLGDKRIVVDLASRRISARIASFNDAHSGFKGAIRSPKNVNVEAAHVGHAQLEDGTSLSVATLPMHTMHAGQNLTAAHAASWYENTGTAVARVRYSIDEQGIRADGVLFDDVSDADLDRLTAGAPSGDWRAASLVRRPEDFENARADFAGACIVNMPGYSGTYSQSPATPLRLVASGLDEILLTDISDPTQDALTAAGYEISESDIREAFNEQNPPTAQSQGSEYPISDYWGVEEFYVQPPSIVVCNWAEAPGDYFQAPWSVASDGSISFGAQTQVEKTWTPVEGDMQDLTASGDNKGDCGDGECCGGACKGDALTAAANLLAEHAAANETTVDALVAAAAPYDAKTQIEGLGAQISDLSALVASMAELLD